MVPNKLLSVFLKNKELFIALYFLLFTVGLSVRISTNSYNEFRVLEILLLLSLSIYSLYLKKIYFHKVELIFLIFIVFGSFFWANFQFIIFDLLLFYLLYKAFSFLKNNDLVTRIIIISSFLIFLMFPFSLLSYFNTGIYQNWYPMPWNIRIYNSYLLIVSIFSIWFYLKEKKYKNIYLVFALLAFLSILLDSGRSATLAYTIFLAFICLFNPVVRVKLLLIYILTWLAYFLILYLSSYSNSGSISIAQSYSNSGLISITRESTSGRYELWVNAFECWVQNPIFGCGFYQLDHYLSLPAHPHNLFIQILTETGLIGFIFLTLIILSIVKKINWSLKENYFVIAAFFAIGIDLFFSGAYIYPVTQVALLWLFVFLLKNPEFPHSNFFNQPVYKRLMLVQVFGFAIYLIITLAFIYLFVNTSILSGSLPSTPPRFWEYGYQLY